MSLECTGGIHGDNSCATAIDNYCDDGANMNCVTGNNGNCTTTGPPAHNDICDFNTDCEQARLELEDALEQRVHLFLFVTVHKKWVEDPERYREMGLDFNE